MARVPSPRHDIDRGLWIPDLREGSFFPLRTCCQNSLPAICPSQRSPTPRLRHCGLSVTSPIRFLPCADGSSPGSSPSYRAAHVAERKQRDVHAAIYDTVVLGHRPHSVRCTCAPRASSTCAPRATGCASPASAGSKELPAADSGFDPIDVTAARLAQAAHVVTEAADRECGRDKPPVIRN